MFSHFLVCLLPGLPFSLRNKLQLRTVTRDINLRTFMGTGVVITEAWLIKLIIHVLIFILTKK